MKPICCNRNCAWDGGLHLAAGVSSIRDMGNNNDTLQQSIAREQAGSLLAPHVIPAGFIEGDTASLIPGYSSAVTLAATI